MTRNYRPTHFAVQIRKLETDYCVAEHGPSMHRHEMEKLARSLTHRIDPDEYVEVIGGRMEGGYMDVTESKRMKARRKA